MFELFETNPSVNVQEAEYKRLLGFPKRHELSGRSRELADWSRDWFLQNGKPWFYARQISSLELTDEKVRVAGTEFSSKPLRDLFAEAQADGAVLVAVSAGKECEEHAQRLWQELKPDEYFFLEMFGSAVVEHLVTMASGRICGWADANGAAALPHYSPGYSGWDVADQIKLWNLIRQNGAPHFNGKLDVLETGMLRPKKSLLTIFGITRNLEKARKLAKLIPCENCSLPNCRYRRAPYLHAPPQIEDVSALLSHTFEHFNGRNGFPALKANAKYAINPRALEKWANERLQLHFLPDNSVEAKFRYEGTTCSNMGRALEFDFRVRLAPPEEHFKILEMNCVPAPGDDGHKFQCEYLNDAESLMRSIANEKPLFGQPLDDVLNWKREYNPAGCFCDVTRREHKWGLVLEAIHFALVQRQKATSNGHSEMALK
ncbi:MAG TPA: hypothetical protein VHG71_01550 [Verrucomicrobiae bacterium]|nr:hypothetical protein [Verrucomicrobiae bacterium]